MKISKRLLLVTGLILVAIALTLLISYRWSLHSDEINRARLVQLIQEKKIVGATVSPTLYPGIYSVEGGWKTASQSGKFEITTHLEEAQVKALLDSPEARIDV